MSRKIWRSAEGSDSATRYFNRGLEALEAGRIEQARTALAAAATKNPLLQPRIRRILRAIREISEEPASIRRRSWAMLARQERAKPFLSVQAFWAVLASVAQKELKRTGRFDVPGMGRLIVQPKAARLGRHPATGEAIRIPPRQTVKFKLAYGLKEAVKRPALRKPAPSPRKAAGRAPARTTTPRKRHAAKTAGKAVRPTKETPRYTDVAVYEDRLYRGDNFSAANRVPDTRPLAAGKAYTLEVAIRAVRTGIQKKRAAARSVRNTRQGTERMTVYIRAKPACAAIRIEQSLAKIYWPFDADSTEALFHLDVEQIDRPTECDILISLYDGKLDLLDVVAVSLPVVPSDDVRQRPGRRVSAKLSWPNNEPAAVRIDPDAPRRDLGIVVRSVHGGFEFDFLVRRRSGGVVKLSTTRNITDNDLNRLLTKVRDFWTDLVITNYAARLEVSTPMFRRYLETMRDLGTEAWGLLFGTRHEDLAGSSEAAGSLLTSMDPPDGARIQIDLARASDFIFPWSLLYPRTDADGPVDAFRFWGARYDVEQVTGGPGVVGLTDGPVKVVFVLDPKFGNSSAQRDLLAAYETATGRRLLVTPPITDEPTLISELIGNPSAHLVYFYCHGYAAPEGRFLGRDGVQRLKEKIDAVTDPAQREALETLLGLTARMGDESWIHIGDAEVNETRLTRDDFFNKRRPIVFLNMCQSANLLPAMSSGLVRVFLDRNASAVVGTESPMTAVFAHAFAKEMFDGLVGGRSIGTALWKARRHFLAPERRNPLGLAYTLYGRGVAMLGDRPLVSRSDPAK